MAFFSRAQHMGAAALIMGSCILLSRFMGLIRDKVISWQFGAASEADIYFTAFVVPDFINHLLAGGYFSITLIPMLALLFEKDPKEAWKLFSAVLFWATILILLASIAAFVAAPQLSQLVAPGFDTAERARLTAFLRIILPAQAFFLPGACLSAMLYLRRQFWIPALSPLIYNGAIILGGLLLPFSGLVSGMEGFCWGVPLGAAIGAFLLPLLAVRAGGLELHFCLWHPQLRRFLLLAIPLMLGQSIVFLDEQFVRIFGSLAGEGAVSLLSYSRRIMLVPVGIVAQAAGVASFPFLATLVARNEIQQFNQTLNSALKNSLCIIIPLSFWMISVAQPTICLLFQGGRFTAEQTLTATPLLQIMMLAVPLWAIQQVIGRAFYAHQNTLTPAIVGTLCALASLPFYFLFVQQAGASGIALAASFAMLLYTGTLCLVWRMQHRASAFDGMGQITLWASALCLPAGLASYACTVLLPVVLPSLHPLVLACILLVCSALLFVGSYLIAALFLQKKLLEPVRALVQRFRAVHS